MHEKIPIPLYAEHLHFLLTRCGWRVTKTRGHYTFEQKKFKKGFVIMNQVSKQNAKTDAEKDFYKSMNNSNFGYDCHNNADNCCFSPINDGLEELIYAKRYQNLFDQSKSEFVSSKYFKRQIKEEFFNKVAKLGRNDKFYDARKYSLEIQRRKNVVLYSP